MSKAAAVLEEQKECVICHEKYNPRNHSSLKRNHCFNCTFWHEKLDLREREDYDGRLLVIGGAHYIMGKAQKPSHWNGMGGSWYYIKTRDGRVLATCDLWHQGEVPWRWRAQFPDNARMMTKEEYETELLKAEEAEAAANSCNVCNGDCAGANPPVDNCPMKEKAINE